MPVDLGRRSILLQHLQLTSVQINFYQVQTLSQSKIKQGLLPGCAVQKEMRIRGEKLLSKEGLDWAACAVACFHHLKCNFWTHHLHRSEKKQLCELSSSDEQKIPAQFGSMTGQKACGKHGADFWASADLGITSAQTNQNASVLPEANDQEKPTPEYQGNGQNTTGMGGQLRFTKHFDFSVIIVSQRNEHSQFCSFSFHCCFNGWGSTE